MSALADPNVAFLLLVTGALGVYAEFVWPGRVLPGVIGGILAVLGLSSLPFHVTGAALLTLGLALLVLEAKLAWRGALGAFGIAAMIFGARALHVSFVSALASIPFGIATVFLLTIARRARANKFRVDPLPGETRRDPA